MANAIPIDRKLSEIFEEGYHLYESFETRQDANNSETFQVKNLNIFFF